MDNIHVWRTIRQLYLGGEKPGKCGRGAAGKILIVVIAEVKDNKIGRIRLSCVPDASAPNLQGAVKEGVAPGTTVCTDGWPGYKGLSKIGYEHEVIRDGADMGKNSSQGQPGCYSAQTLVVGNLPMACAPFSLGLLPRRIHVSVQPQDLPLTWQVVLSIGAASSIDRPPPC
jgi:hypothetical protein